MLKNDFDELTMSPRAVRRGGRGENLTKILWLPVRCLNGTHHDKFRVFQHPASSHMTYHSVQYLERCNPLFIPSEYCAMRLSCVLLVRENAHWKVIQHYPVVPAVSSNLSEA